MKREYHRWYSPRLGIDMGVIVHGHWGQPILGFPTSAGDETELEGQSMIGALADFIEGGKIKFFSINSINGLSFYNKGAHPFHRSYVQSVFDSYLREEVVPFIWDNCQSPGIAVSTMGASFGAYHAANSLFKHPDVIKRCFAMSGVYDVRNFMDGMYDDNFYFNNPVDYLANLNDPWVLGQLACATSTSARAQVNGRTAAPRIDCLRSFPARESAIPWTTGVLKAATTGLIGSTRCANTSPASSKPLTS